MTSNKERRAAPEVVLRSSAGMAVVGQRVIVRGLDLHHECLELGFVNYLFFCVAGRQLTPQQARVFERLWIGTGYPDARIWCNRIAGYMGSARVDVGLAMSAALAATNSTEYGFVAQSRAFRLQQRIPRDPDLQEDWLAEMLRETPAVPGYGRPIPSRDERIASALSILAEEGIKAGPALRGAFWLARRLRQERDTHINILALWAAVAIDWEISLSEYEAFMSLMYFPGYAAVYADQRERPALSFLAGYQSLTAPEAAAPQAAAPEVATQDRVWSGAAPARVNGPPPQL